MAKVGSVIQVAGAELRYLRGALDANVVRVELLRSLHGVRTDAVFNHAIVDEEYVHISPSLLQA